MVRTSMSCLLLLSPLALADPAHDWPAEWDWSVASPRLYTITVDRTVSSSGASSVLIASMGSSTTGVGYLTQAMLATDYRGKRVRYSGDLKTHEARGWAGLWIRVVDANGRTLAFDNMQDRERRVQGDTDWQRFDIVVDVPLRGASVAYGVLLSGTGKLWADGLNIEVVDQSIPLTATSPPPKGSVPLTVRPLSSHRNLDFEQ